eukprot:1490181-Amphidinium_carterae.2
MRRPTSWRAAPSTPTAQPATTFSTTTTGTTTRRSSTPGASFPSSLQTGNWSPQMAWRASSQG